ncbi:MAG TPA: hypothetical protein VHU81_05375 [Thermoanaerobaculia bacterium]|nr:hypothetical protein [Thermoanaerobaculia bacterium]
MRNPKHALLFLVLVLVSTLPAQAANGRWRQLGPEHRGLGQILTLEFDPSNPQRAFAGLHEGGIARSDDGGHTWRSFGEGLATARVDTIAVHPALSRLIYVLTDNTLLHRSLNNGRTWTLIPLREVRTVVPDPRDPDVVWAGTTSGLYRSRDMGTTWERIQGGLPAGYGVSTLAISPVDPRRLYAGITGPSGFGFWVSENGGRTWVRRSRARNFFVYADLHEARTVYVQSPGEIRRSRDAGQTFEPFFNLAQPRTLVADPSDASTFYVVIPQSSTGTPAVYRTTDAGRTWVDLAPRLGIGEARFDATALAVASDGTVLLGVQVEGVFRIYRSEDRGESWELSDRGLVNTAILAVEVTRTGALFIAPLFDDVLRSLDNGATWTSSLDTGDAAVIVLYADPTDPRTVYAGARFGGGLHPHVVWKTTDGGDTWTALPYPAVFEAGQRIALDVTGIAVDPTDPQTVFLSTEINNAGLNEWAGIFRSRDGGQTWEKVGVPGAYYSVETQADDPGLVLALSPLGVYRSTDHGDTWTETLDYGGTSQTLLFTLAVSPNDPGIVYVYRGDGTLYRSFNDGLTWTSLGKRLPATNRPIALAIDPLDRNTIVYQGDQGPVRLMIGAGPAGRMLLSQGLINRIVPVLLFDPNDPTRLLGGTAGAGLMEYRFLP